jgi:hypothetical protein
MRKLIKLGILAILLSLVASPVIAGNVTDCEVLKADNVSKVLYGLCIAFWNAENANARQRILDNYNKKATGDDDPAMPGGQACPCWTDTNIADVIINGTPVLCSVNESDAGLEFAWYDGFTIQFYVMDSFCAHADPFDSTRPTFGITPEEEQACRDDLDFLVDESFGGSCP